MLNVTRVTIQPLQLYVVSKPSDGYDQTQNTTLFKMFDLDQLVWFAYKLRFNQLVTLRFNAVSFKHDVSRGPVFPLPGVNLSISSGQPLRSPSLLKVR